MNTPIPIMMPHCSAVEAFLHLHRAYLMITPHRIYGQSICNQKHAYMTRYDLTSI
jgi:hypothetical protein